MTFSSSVKNELCENIPSENCCCTALCYGILLHANTFTYDEIRIITGNEAFGRLLPRLFRKTFGFSFDYILEKKSTNSRRSFVIHDSDKLSTILNRFGYDTNHLLVHHVNLGILEEDCCKISFIKGAFLAGGSVTNPAKRYHMEFSTEHASVSREMLVLMRELGYTPKESKRKSSHLLYFKQSSIIEELIGLLGAGLCSMEMMNAKIEKSMTNSVNRKVNCDSANVNKAVDAAFAQIQAIHRIEATLTLSALSEKERETALLRLEYPSETTLELGKLHEPPISKSCVNHRLRHIQQIANSIEA